MACLHDAVQKGNLAEVQRALGASPDVNQSGMWGWHVWTPLEIAASNGHVEVTCLLLRAGANASATDRDGFTPLHWAAVDGHKEVVLVLLRAGANPTIKVTKGPCTGATAQDEAARRGHHEIVQLLGGAMEAWSRTFILQMQAESTGSDLSLTFRTLGGNIQASLLWKSDWPAEDLPQALLTAVAESGFECPFKYLQAHNLRLVKPDGALLDVAPTAATLAEQLLRQ